MVKLFHTTYISVDLTHHEIFRAKVGQDGIYALIRVQAGRCSFRVNQLIMIVFFYVIMLIMIDRELPHLVVSHLHHEEHVYRQVSPLGQKSLLYLVLTPLYCILAMINEHTEP